jgi:hypothetical protein
MYYLADSPMAQSYIGMELSLSNFQPAARMCIKLTSDTHHANEHSH